MVVNKIRGTFKSVAVKAPASATAARPCWDIAILTGGQVISEEVGLKLESTSTSNCSAAPARSSTKDETTIVEGAGDPGPDRRSGQPDPRRDRGSGQRLRPRETA